MVQKVKLGRTDLLVNPIGIGANKFQQQDVSTNTEYGGDVLLAAINAGLDFIDTAFIYGNGVSETIIGDTLKKHNLRQQVVIATKGAHDLSSGEMKINNHPNFLRQQVEDSLRRLQTDYLDLYYIHFPDESTPKDEAVGTLLRLKEEGKIRAIGASNFSLEQLKEGNKDNGIDVVQDEYNLINRTAETEFFPYFKEAEIAFIPYFPLASGLLAGKYSTDTILNENQKRKEHFQAGYYETILEKVNQIKPLAEKHHTGLQNVVLAYYLMQEEVAALIPGARNRQQVLENMETLEVRLDAEDVQLIESAFPHNYHFKLN
ncbi:aldo/keto reductase [Jeotgalibaca caeni]|uniref:aldo/keto reductase n=1 Tax=Jeotgalibaca caeni TaxID=3028623 RepID=UPI00237DE477|nr:aldo/keto reductase [Jeotgalibaca caeni]MDE1549513.1 aldo/keto reductase [Jeotgalibaca caeni]